MSSGKIGMVLTYKKKNVIMPQQAPAPAPAPSQPSQETRSQPITTRSNIPRINRFVNTSASMYTIIHTPAKGCSSCGS